MRLGYYKFVIKDFLFNSFRNYKLRKHNFIGHNCKISKTAIFKGNVQIRDFVKVGTNVKLGYNVIVGSNANINNITIGDNSHIEGGVKITGNGKGEIKIGKECYIGVYNILDWSDNITIGNYVHIAGPSTGLWTHSSAKQCLAGLPLKNKDIKYRPTAPITIEDNVYIGGNCIIYPGVTIHQHSIVAPNSTVTKDVNSYTMVGGITAKIIKQLNY